MIPWLSGLASSAWAKLATVGAIAASALGAFVLIRRDGQQSQQLSDIQKQESDHDAASKARFGVDGLGDSAVDERLRADERK